jgi:hypothetical protein
VTGNVKVDAELGYGTERLRVSKTLFERLLGEPVASFTCSGEIGNA